MLNKNITDLTNIPIIDEKWFNEHIYEIRGQKVMLDFDLAEIYGYETKGFNRQVNNNSLRFEIDFRFQLNDDEWKEIRCKKSTASRRNDRFKPYAFTELGIYMLPGVLKGELAIRQSIALIRMFKLMKDYIIDTKQKSLLSIYSHDDLVISSLYEDVRDIKTDIKTLKEADKENVKRSELSLLMGPFNSSIENDAMVIWKGQWFKAKHDFTKIYKLTTQTVISTKLL